MAHRARELGREPCDVHLKVPKGEIKDVIVPKEEITEELEITFEKHEDSNDFTVLKQEVTNSTLHLDDLNEKTEFSFLVPVKTELTLSDDVEHSQEEVSDFGNDISDKNVSTGDIAGVSISTNYSTDESPSPKKSGQSKRSRPIKKNELHTCHICNKQCQFKSVLVTHMRTHSGVKPYACDICNARFATKHHLVPHIRSHTGEKPFKCNHCQAKFNRNNTLKKHMRTHTGEKPYSCDVCQAKFTQKINLIHHTRIHTGEKPYSCYLCQAKFARKNNLNTHMWTHTGGKSNSNEMDFFTDTITSTDRGLSRVHYCNICHVRFNKKNYLIQHMRSHAGVKPYSCELCPKKFTQKSNLNTHMRSHTGDKPYSCNYCQKTFTRKHNLDSHMSTHIGE